MKKIIEAVEYINEQTNNFIPDIAVVLGSGLGELPEDYECIKIPYQNIPNFHKSTIEGHKGQLCFCEINGKKVVMMQGRYHFYEGYSMSDITFPIKVFKKMRIKTIILTNAAGSLNQKINVGDLMLINDHLNLMGTSPLIGKNDDNLGQRFPDMSEVYNKELQEKVFAAAKSCNIEIKSGVYAAMTGPNYETPAEVKMLCTLGADAVGMSTAPEAIIANYCGMNVIGISCITNYAAGVSKNKLSHQEVLDCTEKVKEKFKTLIKTIIGTI